jgi:GH35 family endo-1,4-beta-xylanase
MKIMKLKKVFSLSLFCLSMLVNAQAVPNGLRLQDINPIMLVGCTIRSGNTTNIVIQEGKDIINNSTSLSTTFKREFNLGQATNYPSEIWNNPDKLDFVAFNNTVNWIVENNMPVMAHVLAGDDHYFPKWFRDSTFVNESVSLDAILQRYIRESITVNNNSNKVSYWNVVNEPFKWDGSRYPNKSSDPDVTTCRFQVLGYEDDKSGLTGTDKVYDKHPIYIRKAFEYARQHTDKKLELRDYGAEFWQDDENSPKSRELYQLVKHLVKSGVPIDAVGLQGHFKLWKTYDWKKFTKTIQEYRDLKLEVYITEVDFADKEGESWTAAKSQKQREQYKEMIQAALNGGAKLVCFWGVRDNADPYWLFDDNPLLFNNDLTVKSAYYGVQDGLRSDFPTSENWSTVIQAENYVNSFGVNTQPTTDFCRGLNVANIDDNDYMAYSNNLIDIPSAGEYKVEYRVASLSGSGIIDFRRTGTNPLLFGKINVPYTAGYQSWRTISHIVTLPKGPQTFRIQCEKGGFNLNWFRISRIDTATSATTARMKPASEEAKSQDLKSFVHNNVLTVPLSGAASNVSLYSIDGKMLHSFSTVATEKDIDLSSYKAGVYILKVSTKDGDLTTKVIKN